MSDIAGIAGQLRHVSQWSAANELERLAARVVELEAALQEMSDCIGQGALGKAQQIARAILEPKKTP